MTRLFHMVLVTSVAMSAGEVHAQCSSCATPTVAYAPVVAAPVISAPTVTYSAYTGWYPGRMFDRLRMNRWGVTAAAPVYTTAAYAPAYTAAYAPAYTAAYAPVAAPYVTAYAPLQRTVVSYAPTTVYSPAILEPVVSAGCSTCAASPCSTCVGDATMVEQAAYIPAGGCSTCAEATSGPYYSSPLPGDVSTSNSVSAGPPTPQPQLEPNEPTPAVSEYGVQRPETDGDAAKPESGTAPKPLTDEEDADNEADDSSVLHDFQAPPLLGPQNDRTANRPTVDVHNAVYRRPVRRTNVSATTVAKPIAPAADANGWRSVAER